MFVNGVHPCIPVCSPSLLLKLCELPSVVDLDEDLPHDDEGDAGRHDGPDDPEDDAHDVHHLWALLGRLHPDLKLARLVVVSVYESEPALVIVQVCTQSLVLVDKVLRLLDNLEPVVLVEGALVALLHAPLVLDAHQLPRAEDLALHAGGQLVALAGAGGAVLAVSSTVLTCNKNRCNVLYKCTVYCNVLTLLRFLALALATLAGAVPGAQLVDELPVRGDAGLVTGSTLACNMPSISVIISMSSCHVMIT